VTTSALLFGASEIAVLRDSASCRPMWLSTHGWPQTRRWPPTARYSQPLGDRLLGAVEPRQEHAGRLADLVGDKSSLRPFEVDGGADPLLGR